MFWLQRVFDLINSCFHNPVFICILKYRIRIVWWKCQISETNLQKKFLLVWKRVHANDRRWKRICQIKSSMRIKKVMWLCAMGRHNLTSRPILLHSIWNIVMVILKCWSKVFLYNCLPEQHDYCLGTQASTSEGNCVSSARSEVHWLYSVASPTFLCDI